MMWVMIFLLVFCLLTYHRSALIIYTTSYFLLLALATQLSGLTTGVVVGWSLFFLIFVPCHLKMWRRRYISQPILNKYRKIMPAMSTTEREAITAGTVTWEGDLFRGNPNWHKFLSTPPPKLTPEEQAFLDGPVETLCHMINNWDIVHNRADLPPEMWQFIKEQGFFALIIPKQYGGKQFSAYAHSQIIIKISGLSITVSTTIAVPNSLGPAELLLHYGTEEQKNYYLPRLARGEEVPCFALTSPDAGSDAGSMTDYGIVCQQDYEGKQTLGVRLNWNKRYITLAPIATVIGLAFKLYDPDHLLGANEEIGITCALIPRNTAGITIGRRHFPLNTLFQNGPIQGKDVFIPIDWIIGGAGQVGKGWRMLMECLAAGRAITLPSSALGGAKIACYTSGAYARIRKQFNVSIGKFEGIEELLARMAGYTYIMDSVQLLAVQAIDMGEKPSVASAIVKYHATEFGRKIACDAMDIHGGKGICLGPKNYIAAGYESVPIAITVEGANVLTRNLIIFGQGAIRCHPYVLAELEAARMTDSKASLKAFDNAVMKHVGFGMSNAIRSLILGLTGSYLVNAPRNKTKAYFQQATRFSSAFALIADVSMLSMGGNLKRKESISARLGDILSYLYMLSGVLKHYHDQGEMADDLVIVRFACEYCLFEIQERFDDIIKNYPNRWLAYVLRGLIFPLGMQFTKPKDFLNHKIAQLLMMPTPTRERLAAGAYISPNEDNVFANIQDALMQTIAAEPIEKMIKEAKHAKTISGYHLQEQAQSALEKKIISVEQFDVVMRAEVARKKVITVDDFSPEELGKKPATETALNKHAKTIHTYD
jgi:acyl-CoA dehydrogenase